MKGRNLAASVRQRLLDLARARGWEFNRVLARYGVERLLYRLGQSPHAQQFVLKGAQLFTLWEGEPHRATRDLDLLGFGDNSVERMQLVFAEICGTEVPPDGLKFEFVTAEPITALQEYGGVTLKLRSRLETAIIPVQVDVGFGDHVGPPVPMIEFPTLLDFPPPRLRAYARETVVAEKLHALVTLGMANSRMKDFFDLWRLSQTQRFEGARLQAAVVGTFLARRTPRPTGEVLALTTAFSENPVKQQQWQAFCRQALLPESARPLAEVVAHLAEFLLPPLQAPATFVETWPPGGNWR